MNLFLVFDDEQKNFNFMSVNNQCQAVLHTSELELNIQAFISIADMYWFV